MRSSSVGPRELSSAGPRGSTSWASSDGRDLARSTRRRIPLRTAVPAFGTGQTFYPALFALITFNSVIPSIQRRYVLVDLSASCCRD